MNTIYLQMKHTMILQFEKILFLKHFKDPYFAII